jgi:hypothetical protein
MINLFYYLNLFYKINLKYSNITFSKFEIYLKEYLFFLNDYKNEKIINEIFLKFKIFYIKKVNVMCTFDITDDEKFSLLSLFLFKSINRTTRVNSVNSINYATSDHVINEFMELYKNLNIFYEEREPTHDEMYTVKGVIFKLIKILIIEKILFCKKTYNKNKTIEE